VTLTQPSSVCATPESCIFCVHWYLGSAALLPEHPFLHDFFFFYIFHVLHSLVGGKEPVSLRTVCSFKCCGMRCAPLLAFSTAALSLPWQQPHVGMFCICSGVRGSDLLSVHITLDETTTIALQYNTKQHSTTQHDTKQ